MLGRRLISPLFQVSVSSRHAFTSTSTTRSSSTIYNPCSYTRMLVRQNVGNGFNNKPFSLGNRAFSKKNCVEQIPPKKQGGFVLWYLDMLEKKPMLTKAMTACAIYTSADLMSQALAVYTSNESNHSWDAYRTIRMSAVGFFMSGPTLHLWFNFLSRLLPSKDIKTILIKMVMGQTLYGPSFMITFFSLNAFAQGESGTEIIARLKRDIPPTMASNLMYWPICDFITFRFVPVQLQPLVSNSFSFVWTIYLTYMAGLKKTES